jgi:hypothetical protein
MFHPHLLKESWTDDEKKLRKYHAKRKIRNSIARRSRRQNRAK